MKKLVKKTIAQKDVKTVKGGNNGGGTWNTHEAWPAQWGK